MARALIVALCVSFLACGASEEGTTAPAARGLPAATGDSSGEGAAPAGDWQPPPYDYAPLEPAEHAEVCSHTGHAPSAYECGEDADCRICHDGSDCGVPVNLEELRNRGEACQREDAAACEYAAVRCCDGRCRVVGH